jgi:1-acyl-sn-glycerol-3-phosphate acyltransferase
VLRSVHCCGVAWWGQQVQMWWVGPIYCICTLLICNHKFTGSSFHILLVCYLVWAYAETSLLLLMICTITTSRWSVEISSNIRKETLLLIMLNWQEFLNLAWLSCHVKLCELVIIFLAYTCKFWIRVDIKAEYDNYLKSSIHG